MSKTCRYDDLPCLDRCETDACPSPGEPPPFEQMVEGEDGWTEWIHPRPGYLLKCCDCGLVHEVEIAIAEPNAEALAGPLNEGESAEDGVVIWRMRRT